MLLCLFRQTKLYFNYVKKIKKLVLMKKYKYYFKLRFKPKEIIYILLV